MKKAALWLGAATVMAGVAMQRPASAAEMFADVPTDHWAYQAVNNLQERGIVIGYPDGTFGGKRAMTRYEFAVAIDRLVDWVNRSLAEIKPGGGLSKEEIQAMIDANKGVSEDRVKELIDERLRNLPTKEDLETIRRLTEEFHDEIAALGTNLENFHRDYETLKARVAAIEEKMARWHFSGEANVMARGEHAESENVPGFGDQRRPVIDKDSRTDNNGSSNILEAVKTLYSVDFGVTGNIGSGASANVLLNFGNYLPWVNSNRQNPGVDATRGNNVGIYAGDVSTVPSLPTGQGPGTPLGNALSTRTITQGNFGKDATNTSFSEFTPVKAYLNSAVKDVGFLKDNDITVGKFGVQFTPYTLKQVDPDRYTDVTLTDNGEVVATGAMAETAIGPVHFQGYAATHYNGRSINTGYPLFISWGGPHVLSAMDYGALPIDQSYGVHGVAKLGNINIGGTYIEGGLSNTTAPGPSASPFGNSPWADRANDNNEGRAMVPSRAQIFGADLRLPIGGSGFSISGEFASSNTLAGKNVGDREGVYPIEMRNAYDAKLGWASGRLLIAGGYKQVDPFFGSPGSWGEIGRWKNPTNIKGWNANAGYNFGAFTLKGTWEDYDSVRVDRSSGGQVVIDDAFHNKVQHYSAGLSWNLGPGNDIGLGWEQARIQPWNAVGKTNEQYYTIGLGHNFNQNTLVKVSYEIVDYKDNGAGLYTVPYGAYKGGVGVTQLSVRF